MRGMGFPRSAPLVKEPALRRRDVPGHQACSPSGRSAPEVAGRALGLLRDSAAARTLSMAPAVPGSGRRRTAKAGQNQVCRTPRNLPPVPGVAPGMGTSRSRFRRLMVLGFGLSMLVTACGESGSSGGSGSGHRLRSSQPWAGSRCTHHSTAHADAPSAGRPDHGLGGPDRRGCGPRAVCCRRTSGATPSWGRAPGPEGGRPRHRDRGRAAGPEEPMRPHPCRLHHRLRRTPRSSPTDAGWHASPLFYAFLWTYNSLRTSLTWSCLFLRRTPVGHKGSRTGLCNDA